MAQEEKEPMERAPEEAAAAQEECAQEEQAQAEQEAAAEAEAPAEETAAGDKAPEAEETADEEPQEAGDEGETAEAGEKTGFWKRGKKKEDKEKAALKEKTAELEDRVRRQMAEFDNFRRRTEKEKEQMFSMGERSVLEKLLPVIDNFERGLQAIPEEEKDGAVASGMDMIYRQLLKQMEALGVKQIDCIGEDFNADLHNAVMQVQTGEYESGKIAQELQKGYMYHDQVLRHSMVAVEA